MSSAEPSAGRSKRELLVDIQMLKNRVDWLEGELKESHDHNLELFSYESQFRTIFEHSGDAILVVDISEARILTANPAASRFLGYSRAELIALPISKLHPEGMDMAQGFDRAFDHTSTAWTRDITDLKKVIYVTKNGDCVLADVLAAPIRYGDCQAVAAIIRDVSNRERLEAERLYLQQDWVIDGRYEKIIGHSPAIARSIEQIKFVAPTLAAVLVTGEAGTGKELVARAIHLGSDRAAKPLIRLNCRSIAGDKLESEFLGHIKGAYSGALEDRIGRLEVANQGTLFLDEVGALPLPLQEKLLRILQEGRFKRVGENFVRRSDARIIAATNRDLARESAEGRFNQELYFRLSVFPVEVPPLRLRPQDIPPLARHFLDDSCQRHEINNLDLSPTDLEFLKSQPWPGNVRELQNEIERAVVGSSGGHPRFGRNAPAPKSEPATDSAAASWEENLTLKDLERLERNIIQRSLEESKGRIYGDLGAAERLGLRPTTLAYRIKKLNLHNRQKPANIRWDSSRMLK